MPKFESIWKFKLLHADIGTSTSPSLRRHKYNPSKPATYETHNLKRNGLVLSNWFFADGVKTYNIDQLHLHLQNYKDT